MRPTNCKLFIQRLIHTHWFIYFENLKQTLPTNISYQIIQYYDVMIQVLFQEFANNKYNTKQQQQ